MSEWKECTLGDAILLQRGHDLPKSQMIDGIIPVAGSNGIIGYHSKATTKAPGVTIGRSGNLGNAYLYIQDFWAHNTTLYVKDFKGNDQVFIYYLLKNIDFSQFNVGSAVPTLNRNHIHPIEISIPSYSEQKAIASVLSSLDDKIDLLHRQNKTLEAMAETLFRQWFVEEADESWERCTLDDCIDLIIDYRGKTPKKLGSDWSEYGIPAISAKNIKGGRLIRPETFNYVDGQLYKKWMKDELRRGDILLTSEAPLGELYLLNSDRKYVLSQRLFALRATSENLVYYLYTLLSSNEGQHLLHRRASGSTVQGIRQSELRKVEILLPDTNLLQKFGAIAKDYFDKIANNSEQIQTLEKLRDVLLPQLMSGEMRVKYG